MQQNPSSQPNSSAICHEILRILWNPKVHCRVHNSLPLVHMPSQVNPVNAILPYFLLRYMVTISSHLLTGFPSGLFPSGFPTKSLHAPLLFSIHTTCPTHHILLDLTTLIISDKQKSEAPHYALFSILRLNTTISIIPKDYVTRMLHAHIHSTQHTI